MTDPDDNSLPFILRALRAVDKPCILAINKIDAAPKEDLLAIMDRYRTEYPFQSMIPISALKGDGLDHLMIVLRSHLRPGPQFFPEEMETDQTEPFLISEIIREKIYLYLQRELPYSSAVTVESMKPEPNKNLLTIRARVHVEKPSQKGIIIGEQGRMIKAIGTAARMELEKRFGVKVFLDLTVGVEKRWTRDSRSLRRLGY
jgi:GTP-binding protein Era